MKIGLLLVNPICSMVRRTLRSDVRDATGSQPPQAVGHVWIAMLRNIFTMAVERLGTPLRRTASARLVHINGDGPLVCSAHVGRGTRIGMRKPHGRTSSIHFEDMRRHRK